VDERSSIAASAEKKHREANNEITWKGQKFRHKKLCAGTVSGIDTQGGRALWKVSQTIPELCEAASGTTAVNCRRGVWHGSFLQRTNELYRSLGLRA
jgi:hypothetical protein